MNESIIDEVGVIQRAIRCPYWLRNISSQPYYYQCRKAPESDTKTRNGDPLKQKMATPVVEYTAAFQTAFLYRTAGIGRLGRASVGLGRRMGGEGHWGPRSAHILV